MQRQRQRALRLRLLALTLALVAASGALRSVAAAPSPPSSYVAAAVQFAPTGNWQWPGAAVLAANIKAVEPLVASAAAQHAQIVVLNEAWTGWVFGEVTGNVTRFAEFCVPLPPLHARPTADEPLALAMATMALKYKVVLVINVCEQARLGDVQCASSTEACRFNSDAVFDEHGVMIAVYRKQHLYGGVGFMDTPITNAPVFFDTSFGVRFGMFVCFDVQFKFPGLDLVAQGIKHFVFSTWWVNTPPAYVAVQIQQGWSRQYSVAMIAAGSGSGWHCSGGGIFAHGDILGQYYNDGYKADSEVVVATVPYVITEPAARRAELPGDLPLSRLPVVEHGVAGDSSIFTAVNCTTKALNLTRSSCLLFSADQLRADTAYAASLATVSGTVHCSFKLATPLSIPPASTEQYALITFDNELIFNETLYDLRLRGCSIMQCAHARAAATAGEEVACEPLPASGTMPLHLQVDMDELLGDIDPLEHVVFSVSADGSYHAADARSVIVTRNSVGTVAPTTVGSFGWLIAN